MSDLNQLLNRRIEGARAAIESLVSHVPQIAAISHRLIQCLRAGGTVYTCGNGGSAAEALHFSEELMGRYRSNRPPFRAICLNADPTALTCIANDFGFEEVFARQVAALLTPRDVLVVFTTSGKSENVVRALMVAQSAGAGTVGLLGDSGGQALALCDLSLVVASNDSAHVQEAHQVVLHGLCEALERHHWQAG